MLRYFLQFVYDMIHDNIVWKDSNDRIVVGHENSYSSRRQFGGLQGPKILQIGEFQGPKMFKFARFGQ